MADYERGARTPNSASLAALQTAFEAAGITFIDLNNGKPGVPLRTPSRPKRALHQVLQAYEEDERCTPAG